MGKSAKKLRSDKRRAQKKAVKAARRALYASYAAQGKKRTKKSRGVLGTSGKGNHAVADCGNPGCKRCYPQFAQVTHGHIAQTRERASSV